MQVRNVVLCCAGVLLSSTGFGCSKPQSFLRGQAIPIGAYRISVAYPEVREVRQGRALLVHLRCGDISSIEEMERFQDTLLTAFSVRDAAGNRYFGVPILEYAMRYSSASIPPSESEARMLLESLQGNPDLTQWVVAVAIPPEARGFSLQIYNRKHREGQPRAAVVDLGR